MTVQPEMPPCPSFHLTKILRDRDRLTTECAFVGEVLTTSTIRAWACNISTSLRVPVEVVAQSCRTLTNQLLTYDLARVTAWRLAANVDSLRRGELVQSHRLQPIREWVAVQILEAVPHTNKTSRYRKPGTQMQLALLTGVMAGNRISYWFSLSQCHVLASRCGFTRLSGKRPFDSPTLLTSLRMGSYLVPPTGQGQACHIAQLDCPSGLRNYNLRVQRPRYRAHAVCPRGLSHECHQCSVGYDECEVATHPTTYQQRLCMVCNNPEAWFDPRHAEKCVYCAQKSD